MKQNITISLEKDLIKKGKIIASKKETSLNRLLRDFLKRIVEEEEKRGLLKTIPLVEKLRFEVACLYLKEERSNPSIKTFVSFIGKKGRNIWATCTTTWGATPSGRAGTTGGGSSGARRLTGPSPPAQVW